MAIYGDEKHNEGMEHIDETPSFTVSLTFECVDAKDPLKAVKKILKWIEDGVNDMVFDVENELTGEKFSVDLSEPDEEMKVLPIQ